MNYLLSRIHYDLESAIEAAQAQFLSDGNHRYVYDLRQCGFNQFVYMVAHAASHDDCSLLVYRTNQHIDDRT